VELPRPRRRLILVILAVLALTGLPAAMYLAKGTPEIASVPFSEFLQHVDAGRVTAVTFDERRLEIVLQDGSHVRTVPPPQFLAANATAGPERAELSRDHGRDGISRAHQLHSLPGHDRTDPIHVG
jgi:hypothetical protein